MRSTGCDVLVVGAGPTGLTMAVELVRRGVAVRIVDAADGLNTETRALGMQARTLELFERHGTVGGFLGRGLRARRFNVFSENRQILRVDFSKLNSRYNFLLMIPQNETQELLADHLVGLGIEVERPVELTGLTQDPDGVQVRLRRADGTEELSRVGWVVAADGAHSTVRHQLGLKFAGSSFEEEFAVADLRLDWALPGEEFFAFLDRGRFVGYFPMLHGWHRIAIAQPRGSGGAGEVTLDELQRAVDVCAPRSTRVVEVRQSGRFRINQRRVEAHSVGRTFLVGDAAHIHSVVGAQGMNTGIQDAFNLGWKLAAVVRGVADRTLLDTYAAERAPVAERLVTGTRRVTRMALLRNPVATGFRRNVVRRVLARGHVQRTLTRAISQIDISYHDDSASAPEGRVAAGDRAPDVVFAAGPDSAVTHLHDRLHPEKYTLLAFGVPTQRRDEMLDGYADLIEVVPVDDPEAAARYGIRGPGTVLIRPDGYIAHRSTEGVSPTALRSHLERYFRAEERTG